MSERIHIPESPGPRDRIVAVERMGASQATFYRRVNETTVEAQHVRVSPWLVSRHPVADGRDNDWEQLRGSGDLAVRTSLPSWQSLQSNRAILRERDETFYAPSSVAEQTLVLADTTLFRMMDFADLVRMQLDIETTGLDFTDPTFRIFMVAVRTSNGARELFTTFDQSEATMLQKLGEYIDQLDPDVIEGHNIFNFDLPALMHRARMLGVSLHWGRDKSVVRSDGENRFKAGPRTIPYNNVRIHGRHVIDTYQQIQRYDIAGLLRNYQLKSAVTELNLRQNSRIEIPGDEIALRWQTNPEEVKEYALSDVDDVALLSTLCLPTEFYQAQLVPRSLQEIAVGGPGEKINTLLASTYTQRGCAIPLPGEPEPYPGGYTELRRSGVFRPVVKCDVESLYPGIMLAYEISPESDHEGIFLPLLRSLTERRLNAKRAARDATGQKAVHLNGLQSSLKVLINSFYGYLGYNRAFFNDYEAARKVTVKGQEIIKAVVTALEERGAIVIEIDTDGVFFQPPETITTEVEEETLITDVSNQLPPGINLAHDGRAAGMLSLRSKNYALLNRDGSVTLKGSSLRSRRDELVYRAFIEETVRTLLTKSKDEARSLYLSFGRQLQSGELQVEMIARSESITEKTFTSTANRRLAATATGLGIGERIDVYERADGMLARAEEYAGDPNREILLKKLHSIAHRFDPVFDDDNAARHCFPLLSTTTDIERLEKEQPTRQLDLFG